MTNVVQVRLLEDTTAKRYTYRVPSYMALAKGDVVRVTNRNGKDHVGICVCESEELSDNAIGMIMSGMKVVSWVTGIFHVDSWKDQIEHELKIEKSKDELSKQ